MADGEFQPPARLREVTMAWGSRFATLPDGTTVEKRQDGSKVTTWLGKDGAFRVMKETLPDGTKITQRADGTTTVLQPDGVKVVHWPDGTSRETRPDGTKLETAPDGTTREVHPSGASTMRLPDGSCVEEQADGSKFAILADGSRVETRVDGSKVTVHKDGTKVESRPDGSKSTTWPDGVRKETRPDGGKVTVYKDGTVVESRRSGCKAAARPNGSQRTAEPGGVDAAKAPAPEPPLSSLKRISFAEPDEAPQKASEAPAPGPPASGLQRVCAELTDAPEGATGVPDSGQLASSPMRVAPVESSEAPRKEAPEGEAGEEDQPALPASWRRLPLQLQRLPRHRVFAILQSLVALEEVGITSVPSEMLSSLEQATVEEHTDYELLCWWARTPRLWRAGLGDVDPGAHCRLWGRTPEEREVLRAEAAKERSQMQELMPATPAVPSAGVLERRRRGAERSRYRQRLLPREAGEAQFDAWWAAMLQAERELQGLAADRCCPRSLGEGPSALFSEAPSPWPEPPEPPARRRRRAAEARGGASLPPPRRREGHERCFGSGVWFMRVGEDFFGERPPIKPRPRKGSAAAKAAPTRPAPVLPSAPAALMLHLGGAGCGIGLAAWSQLCAEHGLSESGQPLQGEAAADLLAGFSLHFAEGTSGHYVPRSIFVDCSCGGLDAARAAGLFASAGLIELTEATEACWGSLGSSYGEHCTRVLDAVRLQMEQADAMRCFALTHSLQGQTGGALAAGVAAVLAQEHPKLLSWSLVLAPGQAPEMPAADSYGTLLCLRALRQSCGLVTLVDNDALHRLATSRPFGLGLETAGFAEYNGMIGHVLADFTSPMRAGSRANASDGWSDLVPAKAVNNLVPFPRLNFTFAAIAPLAPKEMADFVVNSGRRTVVHCLERGALLSGQPLAGRCLTTALWCRGLTQAEALSAVQQCRSRRDICVVDFLPGAFAVGSQPARAGGGPSAMALRSSLGLHDKTAAPWRDAFDAHFAQREGVAAFLEDGRLEEGDLLLAREDAAHAAAEAAEVATEEE